MLSSEAYKTWGYGKPDNFVKDVTYAIGWLLVIPTGWFTAEGSPPANPYLVDGALGALLFGLVSLFWQTLGKEKHDE